eukprot:3145796-Rhodomonas_salina.3
MAAGQVSAALCCGRGGDWWSDGAAGRWRRQGGQGRGECRLAALACGVGRRMLHDGVMIHFVMTAFWQRQFGQTALQHASREGRGEAVKVLLKAGADKNSKDGVSIDVQLMRGGQEDA